MRYQCGGTGGGGDVHGFIVGQRLSDIEEQGAGFHVKFQLFALGRSLPQAVQKAVDLLERLIFMERDVAERNNGIRIEKYLSVLTE